MRKVSSATTFINGELTKFVRSTYVVRDDKTRLSGCRDSSSVFFLEAAVVSPKAVIVESLGAYL